jgi:hypothetical protein
MLTKRFAPGANPSSVEKARFENGAMAVLVVCQACGGRLHAPSQLLGRMAKCPQCGQTIKVAQGVSPPPLTQGPPASKHGPSTDQPDPVSGNEKNDGTETPAASAANQRNVVGLGTLVLGVAVCFGLALAVYFFWLGDFGIGHKSTAPGAKQDELKGIAAAGAGTVPVNPVAPKPSEPEELSWTDASKGPVQHGDVRVQLTGVTVRNVRIKDMLGEEFVSPTKHLAIRLEIFNTSSMRKLDFLGWSETSPDRNAASLTDNFNRLYNRMSPDPGAEIPGQIITATSLYPGKQLEDLLVFEPPVDKIQFLRLQLPAAAFGSSGSLNLQIPDGMVHR